MHACSVHAVTQLCPHGLQPTVSSDHGILQARILELVVFPPPGDLPDPGIKPTSPESLTLVSGFFSTEPPRNPFFRTQLFSNMYNFKKILITKFGYFVIITKLIILLLSIITQYASKFGKLNGGHRTGKDFIS